MAHVAFGVHSLRLSIFAPFDVFFLFNRKVTILQRIRSARRRQSIESERQTLKFAVKLALAADSTLLGPRATGNSAALPWMNQSVGANSNEPSAHSLALMQGHAHHKRLATLLACIRAIEPWPRCARARSRPTTRATRAGQMEPFWLVTRNRSL